MLWRAAGGSGRAGQRQGRVRVGNCKEAVRGKMGSKSVRLKKEKKKKERTERISKKKKRRKKKKKQE